MRRTALVAIGIVLVWTQCLLAQGGGQSWQVGYAEADITPAAGEAFLAGFGRPRQVQGTLAPLRAQVLALQDSAGRRALLFTADVLGFSRVSVEVLRRKIEKAHNVEPSAICFAASHTHWGPAINYRTNFTIGGLNVWYLARLEETLLKMADQALKDIAPAEVSYGACDVRIGMCRRLPNERGQFVWGTNPEGSYDEHTPVLRITRSRSPKQVVLVGHACHSTSTGLVDKWSPDYPGAMRNKLESSLDDCRAMFVMGCGGDAKVVVRDGATGKDDFAASPEKSEAAGVKLADEVLAYLKKSQLAALDATLEIRLVSGALSLQAPRGREQIEAMALDGNPKTGSTWWARQSLAYPDERRQQRYDVQAWTLGELTLVALEGEVCADWGPMTRALASTKYAMTVAYANEVPGYIPTARIIREGGYEGDTSHMAYFLPAPFDPKMEVELQGLIEEALGRSKPGGGQVTFSVQEKANVLSLPYFSVTRNPPATAAEKSLIERSRLQAAEEWPARRAQIVANVQKLLGPLPGAAFRVPLDLQVVKEEQRDGYTQKTITYQVDPYDRVESYLLVPHQRTGKLPAMLALHGTHPIGKDRAMGADGDTGRQYAAELAKRGYVVIVPDYWPMGHYRGKKYDPYQCGYASGSIKGVWNHIRAIDLLETLAEVDASRIGSIGHSLGGYNSVFLGALEPRVKAMVSSAGFNAFADYAASPYGGGDIAKWAIDKHLRRVYTVYDNDAGQVPCDFPEMIAALAPRPLLVIAPKEDEIFVLPGVTKCLDAARPVYDLLGARANLQSRFPDGGHDFPEVERQAAYAFLDKHLRSK